MQCLFSVFEIIIFESYKAVKTVPVVKIIQRHLVYKALISLL